MLGQSKFPRKLAEIGMDFCESIAVVPLPQASSASFTDTDKETQSIYHTSFIHGYDEDDMN